MRQAFERCFEVVDGFPRPNWKSIGDWIRTSVSDDDRYNAWDTAAQVWLEKLKDHLGQPYEIDADGDFGMLSPLDHRDADHLLKHAVSAKRSMQTVLRPVAKEAFLGPHILVVFRDMDQYCSYISHFFRDGEYGLAPAVCVRSGYMHMVFGPMRPDYLPHSVTHELTHVLLAHLSLPQWLEEGLAQILEETVSGLSRFRIDHEMADRQRAWWRSHGLDDYWSGAAFSAPNDARELSYGLSQVLVRNLLVDHKKTFFDFVAAARCRDAGEASMQAHLGMSLSDCAAQFLGPGNWCPNLEKLPGAGKDDEPQTALPP